MDGVSFEDPSKPFLVAVKPTGVSCSAVIIVSKYVERRRYLHLEFSGLVISVRRKNLLMQVNGSHNMVHISLVVLVLCVVIVGGIWMRSVKA